MTISPVSSNLPLSFQSIALDNLAPEITPVVDSTKSEQNVVQTNAKILTLRAKISSLYSQITRQQVIATVCSLAAVAFVGIAAYKFSQPAVSNPSADVTGSNLTDSVETVLNSSSNADLLSTGNTTATFLNHGKVDPNNFTVVPYVGTSQAANETLVQSLMNKVRENAVNIFEFMKSIEYKKHLDYSTEKVSQANEMLYNIKLAPQGYAYSDAFNLRNTIVSILTVSAFSLLKKCC